MISRLISVLAIASVIAQADAASEALDLFASMAAALSEDNVPGFIKSISARMDGRSQLEIAVKAMLAQAESSSQIDIVENEGDDRKRTVALDWSMQLKRRGLELRIDRREQIVRCTLVREGTKWRVTTLEPASFFDPPNFR